MADVSDVTVEILKQIRDEIRTTRTDLAGRIDQTNARLDQTNARLDKVEETLLELATQQRFMVKHLRENRDRELRIEAEVDSLRKRVEDIERRLGQKPS